MAVALISAASSVVVGVLALMGVVITNKQSQKEVAHKLEMAQAVTDAMLAELTREVRVHNDFAVKIPAISEQVSFLREDIQTVNKRIDRLEQYHRA